MRTKLVSVRKKAGYTQAALADAVGISRNHYTQIETGDKNPSLPVAVKIKAKLCYKGDDIFLTQQAPKQDNPRDKRRICDPIRNGFSVL